MLLKDENKIQIVVYTAIFGDIIDALRTHCKQTEDNNYTISFVAFLDDTKIDQSNKEKSGWKISPPQFYLPNPRRQARAHKVLAHEIFPDCHYSLWIDGCFQLTHSNVAELITRHLGETDICVFRHKSRNCVYDELEACIDQEKDDPEIMTSQVTQYLKEGYPKNNGLGETTAVLRRHTETTKKFNELWWNEISKASCRDQLSFDYTAWKLGIKYSTFPGSCYVNPYFNWVRYSKD